MKPYSVLRTFSRGSAKTGDLREYPRGSVQVFDEIPPADLPAFIDRLKVGGMISEMNAGSLAAEAPPPTIIDPSTLEDLAAAEYPGESLGDFVVTDIFATERPFVEI